MEANGVDFIDYLNLILLAGISSIFDRNTYSGAGGAVEQVDQVGHVGQQSSGPSWRKLYMRLIGISSSGMRISVCWG